MSTIKLKLNEILKSFSIDELYVLSLYAKELSPEEITAKAGIEVAGKLGNTVKRFQRATSEIFQWEGNSQARRKLFAEIVKEYSLCDLNPAQVKESKSCAPPKAEAKAITLQKIISDYEEISTSIQDCINLIDIYNKKLESLKIVKSSMEKSLWVMVDGKQDN